MTTVGRPGTPDNFLPTRSSLLSRLKDMSDAESWQSFVDDYARLIFQVCLRTGLQRQEAEDVVQETLAAVARQMPKFAYDREKGSFKGWLARVTRNHIADYLTRKTREAARRADLAESHADSLAMESEIAAGASAGMDAVWESEWRQHLLARAMREVQDRVTARSMQIFQLGVVQGWSVDEIAASLRISKARVYLARHRVGRLVKQAVETLRKSLE